MSFFFNWGLQFINAVIYSNLPIVFRMKHYEFYKYMTLKFKTEELVPCIKNLFCWSKNWFIDFKDNTRLLQKMYLSFLVIIMCILCILSQWFMSVLMYLHWLEKHTHLVHYLVFSKKTSFRIIGDTPLEILVSKS